MPKKPSKKQEDVQPKRKNIYAGWEMLGGHPIFSELANYSSLELSESLDPASWAFVSSSGRVYANVKRLAKPEEWANVFGHNLLHLGMRHHSKFPEREREWNAACCCIVNRFMKELQFGKAPGESGGGVDFPGKTEEKIYELFCRDGLPKISFGTAGDAGDMSPGAAAQRWDQTSGGWYDVDWEQAFALGLSRAVTSAINVVGGVEAHLGAGESHTVSNAERARRWFVNCYPLLGALAAAFKLIEDPKVCQREQVSIAAINADVQEIYVNPAANLDEHQARFVMAHEFLHVGLRHHLRCQGRDHYLWNIACDYVINGWLVEMGVGFPPEGLLLDQTLTGLSAEAVYDIIVKDLRRYRKLATLRGNYDGCGDIMKSKPPGWWDAAEGIDLDDFYRRCLAEGLAYHQAQQRGLLPAGLVEEIRVLSQPPMPWDVELAQWFDHNFPPLEKRRSYARPSRRQSSTPDIPRPRYVSDYPGELRTFGVVLDTSGSMNRILLGKALGAIASYSIAREVPFARLICCDAEAYDYGYVSPDEIAHRVEVKGRGGTVLQPAVDLLETAKNFPPSGPILIITDGFCDEVEVRRKHAFLIPAGVHLPFKPKGDVFRIR